VLAALSAVNLAGVIICPSNPYLSIDPLLALPKFTDAVRASGAPVIGVSPLIGGRAVKGPTAKIMRELGLSTDVGSIVQHYNGVVDGFVLDEVDKAHARELSLPVLMTNTLMRTLDDKIGLARECLAFCARLGGAAQIPADRARA
jgi:LPPG:FO 2-phospho-L-lactate transferase